MCVTSYREGAVVSSVYDETVHMKGDWRGLGVRGIVTGTVILKDAQYVLSVWVQALMCVKRGLREIIHIQVSTSVPELICSPINKKNRKKAKRSFYVTKHSVQIEIPIRPWFKIFNLVIGAAVLYGSELWGLLLQHKWKKYDKYPDEMLQEYSSSTISCR